MYKGLLVHMVLTLSDELGFATTVLVAALLSCRVEVHVVNMVPAVQPRLRWKRVKIVTSRKTMRRAVLYSMATTSLLRSFCHCSRGTNF